MINPTLQAGDVVFCITPKSVIEKCSLLNKKEKECEVYGLERHFCYIIPITDVFQTHAEASEQLAIRIADKKKYSKELKTLKNVIDLAVDNITDESVKKAIKERGYELLGLPKE